MPTPVWRRSAYASCCRDFLHLAARTPLTNSPTLERRLTSSEAYIDIALGIPRAAVRISPTAIRVFPALKPTWTSSGGVDFEKGCYVGQEVVSRVEHRASAAQPHRFRSLMSSRRSPACR